MSYEDERKAIEDHVTSVFLHNCGEKFTYHNFKHTRAVVDHAREIALFYKSDDEHLFVVEASAWFHDVGYLFKGPKDHEQESVLLMKEFFTNNISIPALIGEIERCIMATKKETVPVSISEKIICDADTYHFGTTEFQHTDPLVRKEVELLTGSIQTNWVSDSIRMLTDHQFYTSYCKELLDKGKQQNIAWLRSKK